MPACKVKKEGWNDDDDDDDDDGDDVYDDEEKFEREDNSRNFQRLYLLLRSQTLSSLLVRQDFSNILDDKIALFDIFVHTETPA